MNILIISYYFPPENKPRSFRVSELAKGLAGNNHKVELIVPCYENNQEIEGVCIRRVNFKKKIEESGKSLNAKKKNTILNKVKQKAKWLGYYILPDGKSAAFFFPLFKTLTSLQGSYDVVISVSHPYVTHLATIVASKFNRNLPGAARRICEFGDTLVDCPAIPDSLVHKAMEKFIASESRFLVSPTILGANSLSRYSKNAKVIPQGFNFDSVRISPVRNNIRRTFVYAGSFHKLTRNPIIFLNLLLKIETDFHFKIFTNTLDENIMSILNRYIAELGDKISVSHLIARDDVIYEMSKADFVVFQENVSSNQSPSKIVDCKLSSRPIFSYSQDSLEVDVFFEFLKGNYRNASYQNVDISKYDIKKVVREFEILFGEINQNSCS